MTATETPTVKYAEKFTAKRKDVKRYGPWGLIRGQSASGYGSKIPNDYMIHFDGDPAHRWYRVYTMIYSNSGTCYVIRGGERLIVREYELEEQLEKAGDR